MIKMIEASPADGKKVQPKSNVEFLISRIGPLVSTKEQGDKIMQWLQDGVIYDSSSEGKKQLFKLTKENKRELIRSIFSLPDFDRSTKFTLLDKVLSKDKSDKAVLTRIYCKAA